MRREEGCWFGRMMIKHGLFRLVLRPGVDAGRFSCLSNNVYLLTFEGSEPSLLK